jgi:hypothetical protein
MGAISTIRTLPTSLLCERSAIHTHRMSGDERCSIEISNTSTIQDGVHPVIENGSDLPSHYPRRIIHT